jgi:hypothetical protein
MNPTRSSLAALFLCSIGFVCLLPATDTIAQSTTIYTNQNLKVTGIAKGRYELAPSTRQFKAAEANPIDIQMHDTNVHAAHITLRYIDDKGESTGLEGYSELVFKYHEDGSRYFNITPQRVGKMQIVVTVMFEDGRVEIEKINDAEVIASNG